MKTTRSTLLAWAEQGHIAPTDVTRALAITGVLPSALDWRRFVEHLLLWLGVVLLSAGVIFFFAYNWNDLGRYTKFGLIEALILAGLVASWRLGVEQVAGKATLLGLSLLVGALLALIGQVYQTGADTFELFAAWALAILPWVILARFAALWVLWLALINAATVFYYLAFGNLFWMVFAPTQLLWALLALNTSALAVWEVLAATRMPWLSERWAPRLLATASGGLITTLLIWTIVDWPWREAPVASGPVWLAWMAAVYHVYRQRLLDLYVLAGGALSMIVVITVFLARHLLHRQMNAGALLLIGLVVIGLSAASGWWLKQVAAREDA